MQSTFQWRLVLEASVGELLWLFCFFLGLATILYQPVVADP